MDDDDSVLWLCFGWMLGGGRTPSYDWRDFAIYGTVGLVALVGVFAYFYVRYSSLVHG